MIISSLLFEMEAPTGNTFAKQTLRGFTLVEVIVAVTILTILATLGFLALSGFSKTTRDAQRITDVNLVAEHFNLNIDTKKPIVTGETASVPNVTVSGSGIVMTGYYGDLTPRLLDSLQIYGDKFTTNDGFQSYKYGYYPENDKYQVSALLEDQASLTYDADIFQYAHAESQTIGYAYIKGNFTSTGWTNSLIPDPVVWTATVPDGTGLRIIAGTGTLQNAGSSANSVVAPVLDPCIVNVSNVGQCSVLP